MKKFHEHPSVLLAGGMLCLAFALNACSGDETPLPPRESAEAQVLYEQCLKILPPAESAELQRLRETLYPMEMARHDDLLRLCRKMTSGQTPAP